MLNPNTRSPHRRLAGLLLAGLLALVFLSWLAATPTALHGAGHAQARLAHQAYLPLVAYTTCLGNAVVNPGFEQGDDGWHQYTTGTGWKAHDLIGSEAEGFHPFQGVYAARLGGYEGVWDVLTQTVTLPAGGQLSYWWQMGTYETTIFHDSLCVDLQTPGGDTVAVLACHGIQGPQGLWQEDRVDVSAYAGQALVLRFHAYNDNYFFSWFDIDNLCLQPTYGDKLP